MLGAKDEANEIIKELNSMTEKDNLANANEARNKLNSSINKLSQLEKQNTKKNLSPEEIQIGMEVFYTKFNSKATVIELPNSSNEVTIQVGSLTMKAKSKRFISLHSISWFSKFIYFLIFFRYFKLEKFKME